MKYKSVSYASLANLGNYENERIELVAELEEGDDWLEVLEDLKEKVHRQLTNLEDYRRNLKAITKTKNELADLTFELEKAQRNWEVASNFLKAQGLKTNTDEFPDLPMLAPAKKPEAIEGILEM